MNSAAPRSTLLGAGTVVLSASLFGSLGVLSKIAYGEGMAPFAFVTWRAGVGALALWLFIVAIQRRGMGAERAAVDRRGRTWLLIAVVLAAVLNLASFLAFEKTSVALALLAFYTYPAMVAGGSVLLGRERLDLARVAALLLALGGMVAVVMGGPTGQVSGGSDLLGIGLALVAAICQTAFVLTSRAYRSLPADHATWALLLGSTVIAGAITVASNGPAALAFPLGRIDVLGLLLYVGVFAAAVPSVLFLRGIRWIGGVRTGILMLFEPVVGVILAAVILAEGLEPLQVAGGATILLAALIVQRSTTSRPDPAHPDEPPDPVESIVVAPAPGGP
ncbi:MAG TPA: DMT family transporter [Candidatus Limnocylindrales bacterium]|nr:DMT family transporter [Candidatus Limnocylindrales bacterium]